ncbi:MAG: preprotein translocase subunit SecE [Bdellovibrionota bacterium]
MDNRKIILSFYVACAMVIWFLSREGFQYVYLQFYQVRRLPGVGAAREVLPVVLGAVGFLIALSHRKLNVFMDEAVTELKKVTWPTREEVVRSTTVVIICILVAGLILAGFDLLWGKVISFLLQT